jgi:WD40 repeat protein
LPAAKGEDEPPQKTQITAFSTDGEVLAVADNEGGQISVYDFPSLKRVAVLRTELKGVRCLSLGGDSKSRLLCVNGRNGSCTVWKMPTDGSSSPPTKVQALSIPASNTAKAEFRGCQFSASTASLVTGVNVTEGRGRKMKVQVRTAVHREITTLRYNVHTVRLLLSGALVRTLSGSACPVVDLDVGPVGIGFRADRMRADHAARERGESADSYCT